MNFEYITEIPLPVLVLMSEYIIGLLEWDIDKFA